MRKSVAKILSMTMATALAVSTIPDAGFMTPSVTLAQDAVSTRLSANLLTDETVSELFKAEKESTVSVHDPSIIVGEDEEGNKCYYIFGSHMAWAKSYDLETWEAFTNNINEDYEEIFAEASKWSARGGDQGSDSGAYEVKGNLWAPDVIYNEELGKWCMYMSVNGDDWYSSIVMLTADNLWGDWTYVDTITYSGFITEDEAACTDYAKVLGSNTIEERYLENRSGNHTYGTNCIDACVFYDEDGQLWMSYGSWFGGLWMLKLDNATGLRDYSETYEYVDNVSDPYQGVQIAGGDHVSGEASYIQYIDGYYYLFVTYGGLTATGGYNMRIFRSKTVDGPYTDVSGDKAIYETYANNVNGSVGTRAMTYYKWSWWKNAQVAQGHNSAFTDEDGTSYLIYHTRTDDGTEGHYVRVHQLVQTASDYLVAAPFEYSATDSFEVAPADVAGTYEVIMHTSTNNAVLESVKGSEMTLNADGTIEGAYTGTYEVEVVDGQTQLTMVIGGVTYEAVMLEQTLEGTNVQTVCFTGVGTNDIAFWGAKLPEDNVAVAATATYMNTTDKIPVIAFEDMELKTEGYFGTDISWQSSDEDVIANDGTFTKPDSKTEVTLTMTATKGDYTYTKDYVVTAMGSMDGTEDRYLVGEFLANQEMDLSTGETASFNNPFSSSTGLDISNGVAIKFDVELKDTTPLALSNILAFTGEGRLYFAGGSYLGYNATGGWFDANLKNYGIVTDYIGTYNKVTVEIKLTQDGYAVYVDDKLAYSNETMDGTEAYAGTLTDYKNVLDWLSDKATTLELGSGNWWADAKFNGTISNIQCFVEPVADAVGFVDDEDAYVYYEDHDGISSTELLALWPTINLAATTGSDDIRDDYMLFTPGTANSRAIETEVVAGTAIGAGYSVSVDMKIKAGNNQQTEFAIKTDGAVYSGNNKNNGIESGYIVKLAATNSTTWSINGGSETVEIPADAWINITADIKDDQTADVVIKNEAGEVLYSGNVAISGSSEVTGLYIKGGRYNSETAVDKIKVYETGKEPAQIEVGADKEIIEKEVEIEGKTIMTQDMIFFGGVSEFYTIEDGDELTFTLSNTSAGVENWDNWCMAVSNLPLGAEGYIESMLIRSDNYGWGVDYAAATHNIDWSDWTKWVSDHAEGVDVTVKVKRSGADFTVTAVTTAKDGTVYNYETSFTATTALEDEMKVFFTGENCDLVIKNVEYNENETYAQNPGWWSAFSDYYTIGDGEKLTFTVDNIGGAAQWNNWLMVVTNDKERGADGYAESILCRADNWSWGADHPDQVIGEINLDTWEEFTARHAEGAEVVIELERDGIDFKLKVTSTCKDGKVYTMTGAWTATNVNSDIMNVFLSADGSTNTIKTVKKDYSSVKVIEIEKEGVATVEAAASFEKVTEGYTGKSVVYTITNTGETDITNMNISLDKGEAFEIVGNTEVELLKAGESVTVEVKAVDGLLSSAEAYTDRLVVTSDDMTTARGRIVFVVEEMAEAGVKNPNPSVEEETTDKPSEDATDATTEETTNGSTEENTTDTTTSTETTTEETTEPEMPEIEEGVTIVDVKVTSEQYTETFTEEVVVENLEETLEGTEWWKGNQVGKEYALSGDGTVSLKLKFIDTVSEYGYGAFSVELYDADGKFITTGSDMNAWYFGATGDAITGIPEELESTIEAGKTYTVNITQQGSKFVITYLNEDGSKYCEIVADNTDIADDVNIHIIAQVGKYEVYTETTETVTTELLRTKTTEVTTYSDGSIVTVVTVTDETGNVLSKVVTKTDAEGNITTEEESATTEETKDEETSAGAETETTKNPTEEATKNPVETETTKDSATEEATKEETTTVVEDVVSKDETTASDSTDDETKVTITKEHIAGGKVSAESIKKIAEKISVVGVKAGIVIVPSESTEDEVEKALKAATKIKTLADKLAKKETVKVIDLKLNDETKQIVQPDGTIQVTMPVIEGLEDAEYIAVYRLEGEELIFLGSVEVKDGMFTFETNHFSTYLFTGADKVAAPSDNGTQTGSDENADGGTQTGDRQTTMPIVLLVAGAGVAVVASKKKREEV